MAQENSQPDFPEVPSRMSFLRNSPQRPKTSPTQNGAHQYSKISKQRLQPVKQHSLNRQFNRLFRRRRTLRKMAIKNPIQKIGCASGQGHRLLERKAVRKIPKNASSSGMPSLFPLLLTFARQQSEVFSPRREPSDLPFAPQAPLLSPHIRHFPQ